MKLFQQKRALSPLVATLVLVVFSLVVGTLTMTWGETYVEALPEEPPPVSGKAIEQSAGSALDKLQVEYVEGRISEDEYLRKKKILTGR